MAHQFPNEYDHEIYLNTHPDLQSAGFDAEGLYQHYLRHGKNEGRTANSVTSREEFAGQIPEGADILEILPGFAPLCSGPNVKYFETNTKEELTNRAEALNVDTSKIADVHYYRPDGDLNAIGRKFDFVVSAHVLNRQPDPIHHLQQIENILSDNGCLMMVLPDKRYTYDQNYPETTLTSLLVRHLETRKTPTREDYLAGSIMRTHAEANEHWKGDHGQPYPDLNERLSTLKTVDNWNINGLPDREITTNTFTPDSIRTLAQMLKEAGFINLDVIRIYPTTFNKQEFYVILQRPKG
ncbi:MAG: methyltransferase domain-containing protein [Chitinophagaceae bacterium]|nr:methyltransferase domain-containing protein [Chitinophagaceae bacterium]